MILLMILLTTPIMIPHKFMMSGDQLLPHPNIIIHEQRQLILNFIWGSGSYLHTKC